MVNDFYAHVKRLYQSAKDERSSYDGHFNELASFIYPEGGDFYHQRHAGSQLRNLVYDSTASMAARSFAAGLGAFVTPRNEPWLQLSITGIDDFQFPLVKAWLQRQSTRILIEYAKPHSRFYSAHHESRLALASVGNSPVFQEWSQETESILFRNYPFATTWFTKNYLGVVDSVFRECELDSRQVRQQFGNAAPPEVLRDENNTRKWCVVHAVFPRSDRRFGGKSSKNFAFASVWFIAEGSMAILKESGYNEMPYTVARWIIKEDETYGRSPGSTCLPDIRKVNCMERTQLRSAAKLVDPPMMQVADAVIGRLKTQPASIIEIDGTVGDPRFAVMPLPNAAHYDVGEDKMMQIRRNIRECFFAHLFEREFKRERQTAFEISDERMEMLNQMGPELARYESEVLTPTIKRTFNLLRKHGQIEDPPPEIDGLTSEDFDVIYTSPAAQAQLQAQGIRAHRFVVEELVPLLSVFPEAARAINPDRLVQYLHSRANVPMEILRDNEEIAQIAAQQEQAAQLQALAAAAPGAAGALKDVATAQEKGLNLQLF